MIFKILNFYLLVLLSITVSQAATSDESTSPPIFSHPASTFTGSIALEFTTDNDESTIYYTDDGSIPDTNDNEYQGGPIYISGTKMIRARAYRDGYEPSEVVTKVYSRLEHTVRNFSSDLPLVIVHQFDVEMIDLCDLSARECDRTVVYFSVIDLDEDGRARLLSDDLHVHGRSHSNYRGQSSLENFPKRQFGVRLLDEDDENRNEPILGMPSENNWIMHAPYDDKTLIRNAVAYQLSEDMGRWAPRTRFVELFLHNGDGAITQDHYHGVYMLTERIKWDNNRVNIEKITPDDISEPEITGGYIINHELHGRETHIESTNRGTPFALVRPHYEDITPEQKDWIGNYIGDLETALFSPDFRDPETGYAAYLEPESFIDHHWITETLKEIDGFRLSTYLYKDREQRLVMGPVWDYNISLGNIDFWPIGEREALPAPWEPQGWYHELINETHYMNGWYTRLFEDPDFKDRYQERWWELRDGTFSTEHIVNMIENYAEKLDESQQRNFERWPILGQWVWPNYFVGDSYEEEINYMTNWITQRLNWIDLQMGPRPELPEYQLRYFWYFGDELVNNTPLETLEAGYALINPARLHFHSALDGYPFYEDHELWRKASMERRNRPTEINYQPTGNHSRPYDEDAMRALQVKQPFTGDGGENTLIFELPTTDMSGVMFRFAAMDEGAADALLIDYSVDAENTDWTAEGLSSESHALSSSYQLFEVDFTDIPEVNDNPDFLIRIRFDGEDMSADEGNRVTFNNISLDSGVITANNDNGEQNPYTFQLQQNYPNPFNPSTMISYSLEQQSHVELTVYNIMGQRVAVLVNEIQAAGEYSEMFNASNFASGVYIYELRTGNNRTSRKMLLVK